MDDEPMEPRIEALRFAERRKIAPGAEECLLAGVLSPMRIAQDPVGQGIAAVHVARRERRERLTVAGRRLNDEILPAIAPPSSRPAWPLHRVWSRPIAKRSERNTAIARGMRLQRDPGGSSARRSRARLDAGQRCQADDKEVSRWHSCPRRSATRSKKSQFGLPEERKYPMPDKSHARNAKARAAQQEKKGTITATEEKKIDRKADRVLGKSK